VNLDPIAEISVFIGKHARIVGHELGNDRLREKGTAKK
jgi:hypothetical protein